jgi:hypothetical protein
MTNGIHEALKGQISSLKEDLQYDKINPLHYQVTTDFKGPDGKVFQAIHVIEIFDLDFTLGNSVKYILRCGKKPDARQITDLEKAIWYIQRRIQQLRRVEDAIIDQSHS